MFLAETDICACVVAFIVGLLIAAGIAIGIVVAEQNDYEAKVQANARKAAKAKLQEQEAAAQRLQAETEKWAQKLEKWRTGEDKRIAKENDLLEQKRLATAEEERRIITAIQKASDMAHELPASSAHEALSAKLRELHLQGFQLGKFLTVQFLGSIDGFLRIRWSVQLDRPQPPKVELFRDGDVVQTSWSFAGEHGDQLKHGRRYVYAFRIYDESGRSLGEDVVREIRVPTPQVLAFDVRALASAMSGHADRDARMRATFSRHLESLKLVHELTAHANIEIDQWNVTEDIKRWAKAQVQGLGARLRDENARE